MVAQGVHELGALQVGGDLVRQLHAGAGHRGDVVAAHALETVEAQGHQRPYQVLLERIPEVDLGTVKILPDQDVGTHVIGDHAAPFDRRRGGSRPRRHRVLGERRFHAQSRGSADGARDAHGRGAHDEPAAIEDEITNGPPAKKVLVVGPGGTGRLGQTAGGGGEHRGGERRRETGGGVFDRDEGREGSAHDAHVGPRLPLGEGAAVGVRGGIFGALQGQFLVGGKLGRVDGGEGLLHLFAVLLVRLGIGLPPHLLDVGILQSLRHGGEFVHGGRGPPDLVDTFPQDGLAAHVEFGDDVGKAGLVGERDGLAGRVRGGAEARDGIPQRQDVVDVLGVVDVGTFGGVKPGELQTDVAGGLQFAHLGGTGGGVFGRGAGGLQADAGGGDVFFGIIARERAETVVGRGGGLLEPLDGGGGAVLGGLAVGRGHARFESAFTDADGRGSARGAQGFHAFPDRLGGGGGGGVDPFGDLFQDGVDGFLVAAVLFHAGGGADEQLGPLARFDGGGDLADGQGLELRVRSELFGLGGDQLAGGGSLGHGGNQGFGLVLGGLRQLLALASRGFGHLLNLAVLHLVGERIRQAGPLGDRQAQHRLPKITAGVLGERRVEQTPDHQERLEHIAALDGVGDARERVTDEIRGLLARRLGRFGEDGRNGRRDGGRGGGGRAGRLHFLGGDVGPAGHFAGQAHVVGDGAVGAEFGRLLIRPGPYERAALDTGERRQQRTVGGLDGLVVGDVAFGKIIPETVLVLQELDVFVGVQRVLGTGRTVGLGAGDDERVDLRRIQDQGRLEMGGQIGVPLQELPQRRGEAGGILARLHDHLARFPEPDGVALFQKDLMDAAGQERGHVGDAGHVFQDVLDGLDGRGGLEGFHVLDEKHALRDGADHLGFGLLFVQAIVGDLAAQDVKFLLRQQETDLLLFRKAGLDGFLDALLAGTRSALFQKVLGAVGIAVLGDFEEFFAGHVR